MTIDEALHIFYMGPGFSQRYYKKLQKQVKGKLKLPTYARLKQYEKDNILVELDPIYKEGTGNEQNLYYWENFIQSFFSRKCCVAVTKSTFCFN